MNEWMDGVERGRMRRGDEGNDSKQHSQQMSIEKEHIHFGCYKESKQTFLSPSSSCSSHPFLPAFDSNE